jgi:hypothetical protein
MDTAVERTSNLLIGWELRDDVVEAVAYRFEPDKLPIFHRVGSYCARNAELAWPPHGHLGREFLASALTAEQAREMRGEPRACWLCPHCLVKKVG